MNAAERSVAGIRCALFLLIYTVGLGHAVAETRLEIGYVPILPVAQLYVLEGEGWASAAGLTLNNTAYSEGPGLVQALVDGKLDVAYFGIAPAMLAVSKGVDIRVVASNVVEQVALIVRGDLRFFMLVDPVGGISRFTAVKKRKPRIATFPSGSVPDAVFRHWLLEVAKLPLDSVEIVPLGADKLQKALLAGEVDGASILEPILTVVASLDRTAKVVLDGAEMMPNQPGAILAVRAEVIRKNPQAVRKLVELHHRATEFLIRNPDRAAKHALAALQPGQPQLTLALVEKAMTSPYLKFVSDPYRILDSTKIMYEFQIKTGVIKKPIKLGEIFYTRFFDLAVERH